jgi:hypothetical protein
MMSLVGFFSRIFLNFLFLPNNFRLQISPNGLISFVVQLLNLNLQSFLTSFYQVFFCPFELSAVKVKARTNNEY